jgi:hypothetical protein
LYSYNVLKFHPAILPHSCFIQFFDNLHHHLSTVLRCLDQCFDASLTVSKTTGDTLHLYTTLFGARIV